jgi:hypothetical protein
MDQVYEVAKSFGMELPNAFSLETLQTFIASLYDGTGARSFVAETWKRFLHSSTYIKKLKGSRTGVDSVINTFGLNSPLIQVKESTYATDGNYIKSDELVYALQFTGSVSSSIWVPFVSSSYSASTLQVRFIPQERKQSSLLTTDGTWGVELVPHPSASSTSYFNTQSLKIGTSYFTLNVPTRNYGKIHVVSGSARTVIASSSYFPMFSDTYTHIMLRSQSQDITIMQTDGDQILYQESASVSLGNLWNTTYVYLGGTGSLRFTNFDGIIDDVRVWGEETTKDNFVKQVYDPGSYYGVNYSSSYNNLYVDLSFSQEYAAITQSATNESPFVGVANITNIPAYGFTTESYVRISRTIKQFTPVVGASIFSNRKVTVATPPVFSKYDTDEDGVYTLSRLRSIKPIEEKKYIGGQDYVQFAVSPTDFVNQTIMRSMGDIDTNYLIGSPSKYTGNAYPELNTIFDFFLENYNEYINVNDYIRFFNNVLKAPTEYINTYVPARSKLVDGIVIESPILSRQRERIQKSIKVDGRNTKLFDEFVAGSGSYTASINRDAGAYDFLAYYPLEPSTVDTTVLDSKPPMIQKVGMNYVTSSLGNTGTGIGFIDAKIIDLTTVGPVSSTPVNELPIQKRLIQQIGRTYVTSSLADDNSGIGFIDSILDGSPRTSTDVQTGYPRAPYQGLSFSNSTTFRILSEVNTQVPYYEIGPRTDFSDVGSTTYFYRDNGYYRLPRTTATNNPYYLAKLNLPIGELESDEIRESVEIRQLPTSSLVSYPGRFSAKTILRTYTVGTPHLGILNIPNVFSMYRVTGGAGLRLRIYSSKGSQLSDLSRPFSTVPSSTAGVLFDGVLTADSEVFPYTLLQTTNSTMYFTVDNLGTSDVQTEITIYGFTYQPANLIPNGYLPRHYKFTRTNNIALKRRNYLGCRIVYCPEGCPDGVVSTTDTNPIVERFTPSTSTDTQTTERSPGVSFGGKGYLT